MLKITVRLLALAALISTLSTAHALWTPPKVIRCKDPVSKENIPAVLVNAESFYSESPIFDRGVLYYVEYSKQRVMTWKGGVNQEFWSETTPKCGPAGITTYQNGFLVACYDSNKLVKLSRE